MGHPLFKAYVKAAIDFAHKRGSSEKKSSAELENSI
jgi:CTP synthase